MRPRSVLPFVVVLAATIVALGQAGWNRSLVRREIVLSEREAPVAYAGRDETALWLQWQYATPLDSGWGGWIGPARLAEMGADTSREAVRHERMDARPAFAVLELDGPGWRAHVERQVAQRRHELASDSLLSGRDSLLALFRGELERGSHLVMVDAGADPDALARRYPDGRRHLILPAVLRTYREYRFGPPTEPVDTTLGARIQLENQRVLVSGRPAAALRPPPATGYRVTVASGRSYGPWVERVELGGVSPGAGR